MIWRAFVTIAAAMGALSLPAFAAPAYDSGGTGTAARLLKDASRASYHGRYSEAIADDTKALARSPSYGEAFLHRARDEMAAARWADAQADLNQVMAMHPDDMSLAMHGVELRLLSGDANGALTALTLALHLPLQSSWHQSLEAGTYEPGNAIHYEVNGHMESNADLYSSIAKQMLHRDDESIADLQAMLKLETQYPEHILAHYCYVAGVVGLLESAELTCDQSIEDNAHDIGQYDSLGFAHLRMKQWDKAIADYNKALNNRPDMTLSLCGRGLAKRAKGDIAGGNADIAAATRDEPDVMNIMKRMGVVAS